MEILLDADASPVLHIVEELARSYELKLVIVKNYNHNLKSSYAEIVTVDNMKEAADLYIMNRAGLGDIVVTQDYGLAAMVLGKGARVLNQYGLVIDNTNIDVLLEKRHLNKELRTRHRVYTKFKKRTSSNDRDFYLSLDKIIRETMGS